MTWDEALPLLKESHTGVAVTITPRGRAHATVVSTAVLDGKVGFATRRNTVKLKNIERTGRGDHGDQARHPALRDRGGPGPRSSPGWTRRLTSSA